MSDIKRLLKQINEADPVGSALAQELQQFVDDLDQLHAQYLHFEDKFPEQYEEIAIPVGEIVSILGASVQQLEQCRQRLVAYLAIGDVNVGE